VPDDAKRLRLTVIGSEPARKQVLQDLASHPALAGLADRLVVQGYDPTAWAVKDYGFVTTGSPTICLQAPDGTVLHRQDTYRGPERLAEAIRRADPSYDPKRDPDLNRPTSPLNLPQLPPLALIAAGLLGAYLLLPRGAK
jgi:hypothetical protein